MMNRFLSGRDLWDELSKWSRRCREPRYIATPYLSEGAAGTNLGGLSRGDVLICALTEHNAGQRSICPGEVEKLHSQGVKVYTQESLHAKLYLLGNVVAVGSPNLTVHSLRELDEACVLTDDPQVVQSVHTWFQDHRGQLVSPDLLARCKVAYDKAATPPPRPQANGKMEPPYGQGPLYGPQHPLWIASVAQMSFPRAEARQRKQGERLAEERLSDRAVYEVESVRWAKRVSMQVDDILVQLMKERRQWRIYPHVRVLGITPVRHTEDEEEALYIHVERLRDSGDDPLPIPWEAFREHCRQEGLTLAAEPDDIDEVAVISWSQKNRILRLTAPNPGDDEREELT